MAYSFNDFLKSFQDQDGSQAEVNGYGQLGQLASSLFNPNSAQPGVGNNTTQQPNTAVDSDLVAAALPQVAQNQLPQVLAQSLPLTQNQAGTAPETTSIAAPTLAPADPNQGPDITVNANKTPAASAEQDPNAPPLYLGNKDAILERQAVQDQNDKLKDSDGKSVHHGMFGVHGTLRDVLGTLGDAFLVNSGHSAIYAPTRDKEQISDAMAGFTQNPDAAAERLTANSPADAMAIAKQQQTNQIAQINAARAQQAAAALAADRNAKATMSFAKYAGNMMAGTKGDPTKQAAAIGMLTKLSSGLAQQGIHLDLAGMGIHAGMTNDEIQSLVNGSINTYQQASLPIRQQNADSGTMQAQAKQQMVGISSRNASTNAGRAAETARHNRVIEPTLAQKADAVTTNANTNRQRANTYQQSVSAKTGTPAPTPSAGSTQPTNGMRRVVNGHTYEWQNGKAVLVK